MEIKPIGTIYTPFSEKFGIPRQSGLCKADGKIVFHKEYRNPDALRGLDGFSHIWILWQFSQSMREGWSATVRPPRMGGNKRTGVFATRSPFRPNSIGLSSVKLTGIDYTCKDAPVVYVEGTDILNGTPIFDIKPYLPFTDSHPDAQCGFAGENLSYELEVIIPEEFYDKFSNDTLSVLKDILKNDPRPAYQNDAQRVYKMSAMGLHTEFTVWQNTLTVTNITEEQPL